MKIPLFQVDAFASAVFKGNPAAVMPLPEFLPDALLQSIAAENNLSETAFLVGGNGRYQLRWFTPTCEVPLCGHATLASAAVVLERLELTRDSVAFETASGVLTVQRNASGYTLNFPAASVTQHQISDIYKKALGTTPLEVWKNDRFTLVLLDSANTVANLQPEMSLVKLLDPHGVIVTAVGVGTYDFVSRFFAPAIGIDEDPVTGSAHCVLAPFWATRLNKSSLYARQASHRGGDLLCKLSADRVLLTGNAEFYLTGEIEL